MRSGEWLSLKIITRLSLLKVFRSIYFISPIDRVDCIDWHWIYHWMSSYVITFTMSAQISTMQLPSCSKAACCACAASCAACSSLAACARASLAHQNIGVRRMAKIGFYIWIPYQNIPSTFFAMRTMRQTQWIQEVWMCWESLPKEQTLLRAGARSCGEQICDNRLLRPSATWQLC